jgi:tetratricopeptide (TPR) repeat protein
MRKPEVWPRTASLIASVALSLAPLLAPAAFAGERMALTRSAGAPEISALLARFYGSPFDPQKIDGELQQALARFPDDGSLHEMSAFIALLKGDDRGALLHFLRASLDVNAAAPEVYLSGIADDTPEYAELIIQACTLLAKEHPNAQVRALAAEQLAAAVRLRGNFQDARKTLDALGFITDWQVIGAFDNDQGKGFFTPFPPEAGQGFTAPVPGVLVPVRFRPVTVAGGDGKLHLGSLVWPNEQSAAYVVTFVNSPKDQPALLQLSTASPTRAWLNDALVLSEETVDRGDYDNLRAQVNLHAGWNRLLIKSANKRQGWSLGARLTGLDGASLPALKTTSAVQSSPVDASTDVQVLRSSFDRVAELERRRFLTARLAWFHGLTKEAIGPLGAFHSDAPDNLIAATYLAQASMANDEQGKALDVLDNALARGAAPYTTSLLLRRANSYEDKRLWEKAQRDAERAMTQSPECLFAHMTLAGVLGKRNWAVDRWSELRRTVARWPSSDWALRELASAEIDRGHVDQAQDLLDRAVSAAPGRSPNLEARVSLWLRRFEYGKALSDNETLLKQWPQSSYDRLQRGEIFERSGRDSDARSAFQSASALSPDWPRPYEREADLVYRLGDTKEAIRLWKLALERDPANGALSERVESLAPTQLGFIGRYVPTDEQIEELLLAADRVKVLPGAQSVMLLDDEVAEGHEDGSLTRVVTLIERAENEQGRDALISERIPTVGHFKMLKAYALSKKGERQEAASIRDGQVRFRNLAVGSIIVLQYVHYEPPANFLPNQITASWFFQSEARQHERSRWVLALPKGRNLNVSIQGDVQHTEEEVGDHRVHTFLAEKVPPLVNEPQSPPPFDTLRRVSVSTVPNWDEYVRWERALLSDAFQQSPEIHDLALRLTADAKTPREKLDKLLAYTQQEVRYQMDYETTIAGVKPHSCRAVLERGYGDCKDKAVLLTSLAREVGIELHFAVLRTTTVGKVETKVPNQQFNHAIVYVPKQEGFPEGFFIDPTTDGLDVGNLRSDDQGALSLVIDPRSDGFQFVPIPYQPPELQYDNHDITIKVKGPESAEATDKITMRGASAESVRRVLRNRAYSEKFFEQLGGALFTASTVIDSSGGDKEDIFKPLTLSVTVDASNSISAENGQYRLRMPNTFNTMPTALAVRKLPLRLGPYNTSRFHIDVELPKGYRATRLPSDFQVKDRCVTIERRATVSGQRVRIELSFVKRCAEISPEDYPAFRKLVLRATSQLQDELVFSGPAKKKAAGEVGLNP